MSEIKFRAWAIASQAMFKPDSLEGWELYKGLLPPLPNTILMQYTGLKDKNGVDLDWWEGDLLKDGTKIMQVIFEDGCFWGQWIKYPENKVVLWQLASWSEHIEKIGNIHQHPHLLK